MTKARTCDVPIIDDGQSEGVMGDTEGKGFHGDFGEWLGRLPTPDGKPFVLAHGRGTLTVELFAPRGVDTQTPHRQDEVYVVVRGEGWFVNGLARNRFGPGDLLFVPAGVDHRFDDFDDGLTVGVAVAQDGHRPARYQTGREPAELLAHLARESIVRLGYFDRSAHDGVIGDSAAGSQHALDATRAVVGRRTPLQPEMHHHGSPELASAIPLPAPCPRGAAGR